MKTIRTCGFAPLAVIAWATLTFAEPSLTIYNQNFAVVRDQIELSLKMGTNEVTATNITAYMEPDSVVLRDPTGRHFIRILEQNYRADPVSQQLLLSLYEGQEIDFITETGMVRGKIIRSGGGSSPVKERYRNLVYMAGEYLLPPEEEELPIIESNGQLRFGLPGEPLFPSLKDDTILKPTLHWLIETDRAGRFDAELCYITGGMSWEADYNLIYPETGEIIDVIGWVTMKNETGKTFENARIKLMAGDVSKIRWDEEAMYFGGGMGGGGMIGLGPPPVSEKTFDEYHLYTLNRRTTLRNQQTKQVEFVRAAGVKSTRLYIYDGSKLNPRRDWPSESARMQREYGTESDTKVRVMRAFKNSKQNNLGIPLPKGRIRFYRRDDDGQLEFTGENTIDHIPRDEKVRVHTGNAFDLVGERRQVDYKIENARRLADESFEIKVRNRKEEEAVEIRVIEHLHRGRTWEITKASHEYSKTDSQTIEFRILLAAGEEKVTTYTVHYTW
jgi:hypothetical protein